MSKSVDISKSVNISKPVNKKLLVVVIIGVLLILFSIYYFYNNYYKSKPVPIEEIKGLSLNIAEYYLGDEDLIVLARGKLIKEENEIANEANTQEYKRKLSQEIEFIGYSSSDYKKTKKKLFILPMSLRHFDVYRKRLHSIDSWKFVENSSNHNRWGLCLYERYSPLYDNFPYISIRYVKERNKLEYFTTILSGSPLWNTGQSIFTDMNSEGTIILINNHDSINLLDDDLIYDPSLLRISSILDWSGFIKSLKSPEAKDKKRIFQLLDNESKKIINAWEHGKKLTDNEKKSLIRGLNKLLKRRDFFDNEVFDSNMLCDKGQELFNKGLENLSKKDIIKFNRLLLKRVYPYKHQIAESINCLSLLVNRNLDIDDAHIKNRFNLDYVHHPKFLDDETIIVLGLVGISKPAITVYSLMDTEKDKKIKIKNYPDLPFSYWDIGFYPLDISLCKSKAVIQTLEIEGDFKSDKWLTICDLNTHEIENVVNLGKQRCNHLKFNHIREEIIAAADDNDIRIIDLNKKQVIKTLTNTYPNSMRWSPDGKKLGFLSAATWRTNIPYPERKYFKPAIWVYDLDNDHLEKIDESYDFVGFFWINRN